MSSAPSLKIAPAWETTFSSIIAEPKSLPPKRSATWPTSGPIVGHETCRLGKLSRYRRARANTRR
jgi:hypothetical protein